MWERSLTTVFTDKRTNKKYEIKTFKFEHELDLLFEQIHRLKVKAINSFYINERFLPKILLEIGVVKSLS